MAIPYFNEGDADRIANTVNGFETMQRRGGGFTDYSGMPNPETIYVKLTQRDAGENGFWKGEEVRYISDEWEIVGGGRKFNGDEYPYIRHFNYEDAQLNQVVKAFLNINVETGFEEWVFDNNVTNPTGLVFYSDKTGGVGQAKSGGTWTTINGAQILTNVGSGAVAGGFSLIAGQSAQVLITFIDDGSGYKLAGASMALGSGDYWTEDNGVIIVKWPIAEVISLGGVERLIQHHVGDLHIEIYAFGYDDEDDDGSENDYYTNPIKILGDGKWIDVTPAGNTFTVSHRRPNPEQLWKTLELNKNGGGFHTVKIDIMGHIISVDDEEPPIQPGDEDIYLSLTSSLASALVDSALKPEIIGGGGVSIDYKVFSNGNNYLDFVNTRNGGVRAANDLGQSLVFSRNNVAEANMGLFDRALMVNNANTSGINITELFFGTQNFRFNANLTVTAWTVGKGLPQISVHNTATCTVLHSTVTTIVRDKSDPNNDAFQVTVSYSLGSLDSAYTTEINFTLADGTPIPYSIQGEDGLFIEGAQRVSLDNVSETDALTVYFLFSSMGDSAPSAGDVINFCSRLLLEATGEPVNVDKCTTLSYISESDYVTDQNNETVLDQNGNEVTADPGIPLPAAACAYPGTGAVSFSVAPIVDARYTWDINAGAGYDLDLLHAEINKTDPLLGSGSTSGTIRNKVNNKITGAELIRGIHQIDVSAGLAANCNFRISTTGNAYSGSLKPKVYILQNLNAFSAETNKTYDMKDWTVLGSVQPTGTGNFDVDVSGILQEGNDTQIGLLLDCELTGDFSQWGTPNTNGQATLTQYYQC